jgi:hypothetical protein
MEPARASEAAASEHPWSFGLSQLALSPFNSTEILSQERRGAMSCMHADAVVPCGSCPQGYSITAGVMTCLPTAACSSSACEVCSINQTSPFVTVACTACASTFECDLDTLRCTCL